jgi:hypothetical protein
MLEITVLFFAVCDCDIDKFGIFFLFGGGEDERGVSGSVLGLVFADCCRRDWLKLRIGDG